MTIKIRTAKYKRPRSGEPLQFKEIEIECKGVGLKEDPFILDSSSDIPNDFEIVESKVYILIKNCNIKYLVLGYSKNITIEDSTFRALYLYNCTDITINKCHISLMTLNICQNCLLKNSKFDTRFKMFKCYNNTIKACEWDVFFDSENLSRGNILEKIGEPFLEDILEIREPLEKTTDSFAVSTSTSLYGVILKDIECQGTGTINDPIIIDNSNVKKANLKDVELFPNRHYVIFKNLSLKKIRLFDAKHVTLENCNFSKSVHLKFCSDIKIRSTSMKNLKFGACEDTYIENSDIKEIEIYKGYKASINVINCTYKKINENALSQIKFS